MLIAVRSLLCVAFWLLFGACSWLVADCCLRFLLNVVRCVACVVRWLLFGVRCAVLFVACCLLLDVCCSLLDDVRCVLFAVGCCCWLLFVARRLPFV